MTRTIIVFFDVEGRTEDERERLLRAVMDAAPSLRSLVKFELRDEKIFDVTARPRGESR